MWRDVRGTKYFRTSEAAQKAHISRSTLMRWIESGIFKDVSQRDRRGWRMFTEADIAALEKEAGKMNEGSE